MNLEIHYEDEWAALYVDGKLEPETVGDSYVAEQRVFELLGVRRVYDNAFMRGGNTRSDVAQTLAEVETYREAREEHKRRAAELRAQAARLEQEAAALERTP